MAATPGSASVMNKLTGYARFIAVTAEEYAGDLGDRVFKKNTPLVLADGKVLIADGTTKLKELPVRVDQVLTLTEKTALTKSLGTGTYVPTEGGVLLAGPDGKLADASLNLIDEDGQIKNSYLSILDEDGKLKLEALPDTARASLTYFKTYADLSNATAEQKKGPCIVIDASGDPTVDRGTAMYVWQEPEEDGEGSTGSWLKLAEVESLDLDIDALTPDYGNVQAAGAVMYDHPIEVGGLTLTQLAAFEDAAEAAEEGNA